MNGQSLVSKNYTTSLQKLLLGITTGDGEYKLSRKGINQMLFSDHSRIKVHFEATFVDKFSIENGYCI